MIIERIKRHNIINGFLFSFLEFGSIALLVGAFSVYFLFKQRYGMGLIGLGIAANCLPVVYYSLRSLRRKQPSIGFLAVFNPRVRKRIGREYPETAADTAVIVVTTLIPFLALLLVAMDSRKK